MSQCACACIHSVRAGSARRGIPAMQQLNSCSNHLLRKGASTLLICCLALWDLESAPGRRSTWFYLRGDIFGEQAALNTMHTRPMPLRGTRQQSMIRQTALCIWPRASVLRELLALLGGGCADASEIGMGRNVSVSYECGELMRYYEVS